MAVPTNRQEFKQYCLRKLGEPVTKINVAEEQVDDRIDEALFMFYERHYEAVEEVYLLHDITAPEKQKDSNGDYITDSNGDYVLTSRTDVNNSFINLPNDIIAVVDVLKPNSGLFSSVDYRFHLKEIYDYLMPIGHGSISHYYINHSYINTIKKFFDPDYQFDFSPITNKLTLAGGLKAADNKHGGVIVHGYRKLHGETDPDNPSNTVINNVWRTKWLQDYATALIKLQWGQNLSKFEGVQMIGGVTLNGAEIFSQATQDIERLEQQLREEYENPPAFFMA